MSENSSVWDEAAKAGAKKGAEKFVDRALNTVWDSAVTQAEKIGVLNGSVFQRYLTNAREHYNQAKTLATGRSPRPIVGHDHIYVEIDVTVNNKTYSTATAEQLLKAGNHILIEGTGGAGKSMLMRYLFVNTADNRTHIPVFADLRRLSNETIDTLTVDSVRNLLYSSLQEFDTELSTGQFQYALRKGKFLFLLDGFDEIRDELSRKSAKCIQGLCSKYPQNPCIVTSRPDAKSEPLDRFSLAEIKALRKEQAVEMAGKIGRHDEKTRAFCRQLEDTLYENPKYNSFAKNPLLLSMMYLTFRRNNSIPNNLLEFYEKAYIAIYSEHDTNDKGDFLREFQCNDLDERTFRLIFSRFCFQTYLHQEYDFSKDRVIELLDDSIGKLGIKNLDAGKYLGDLCSIVCILIKDGTMYRFPHRSFQTFFAAYYTFHSLTAEQQKKLHERLLADDTCWDKRDYYELLCQLGPNQFFVNVLETELRRFIQEIDAQEHPDIYYLKQISRSCELRKMPSVSALRAGDFLASIVSLEIPGDAGYYRYNIHDLFYHIFAEAEIIGLKYKAKTVPEALVQLIKKCKNESDSVSYSLLDKNTQITTSDKIAFYKLLCEYREIPKIRAEIRRYLSDLDAKREAQKNAIDTNSFLDSL